MNNLTPDEKDNYGIITETTKKPKENKWKDIGKISGIYKIINKVNGKYYIGSSNNIYKRWLQHQYLLNKNNHQNQYLQRSWNKYGQSFFDCIIIKSNVSNKNLLIEEQNYLNQIEKNKCYNMSLIAGRIEMTPEIKEKIRQKSIGHTRCLGLKCNPKDVLKRVLSRKWYKHHSEKTKKKISLSHIGKKLSEETKRKVSEAGKGRIPHNYDYTPLHFYNKITNESFVGPKGEFIKKYHLYKSPVYDVINCKNRRKSYKGWLVKSK